MSDLDSAADLLDVIASERCDLMQVGQEFASHDANPGGTAAEAVKAALLLRFVRNGAEARAALGPFAPPFGRRQPATSAMLTEWERLAALVGTPAIKGRLHDLLWIEKWGDRPYEHARAAVNGYVLGARGVGCDTYDALLLLERAAELARSLSAEDLFEDIALGATDSLTRELRRSDASDRPGVIGGLLQLLVGLPEAYRPIDLRTRLEEAHKLLEGSHPSTRAAMYQLSESLAREDPEEVARIQQVKVKLWVDWALQQEGALARRSALSSALELANNTPGAEDLRKKIRLHMQDISVDDLDLQTVSIATEIPATQIEGIIQGITGGDGVEQALRRFGMWGPPTGSPEDVAKAVDKSMEDFGFWQLLPVTITDDQGRPVRDFVTEDEKRSVATIQQEAFSAGMHGSLATLILDRLGAQYAPSQEDLVRLFETPIIRPDQADAFARALGHYWAGRFDESIHIALPRIEAVLRRVLVAAGGVAYTEPQGGRAGHDKTLGTILSELSPLFPDEGWRRSLLVILSETTGLNLRNRYLHGTVEEASKLDAALVLHLAANLRLLVQRQP